MADSDDLVIILGLIGLGYLVLKTPETRRYVRKTAQRGAVLGTQAIIKTPYITPVTLGFEGIALGNRIGLAIRRFFMGDNR